ncbi:MAG: 16S rRNA (uracil(1498)-N(3))-methyltransferase [Firmicutes bacterium]|nr:16S rRNA (uracil(1498)-N(3))-methyltransferase [Bacillota bacterium]
MMHRFFLPRLEATPGRPIRPDTEVLLEDPDARHITRVLRLRPGDRIVLCDGRGFDYDAVVVRTGASSVIARVGAHRPSPGEAPLFVTLVQGVPKADKMDLIVQKAVEVGVGRIIPAFTERTVVRWDAGKADARRRRWQRIAAEAAKQSGRGRVPEVAAAVPLREIWRRPDLGTVIVPWEEARGAGLRRALAGVPRGPVTLVIGPEGGLSRQEVDDAVGRGAFPVTLGPRVLRTETAGLVAAAIVLYEWGDLGGDTP